MDSVNKDKKFPPQFLDKLTAIREQIISIFTKESSKVSSDGPTEVPYFELLFNLNKESINENIDNLIDWASKDSKRLMVRSTGKEDTKDNANAGGNDSIPNVEPNNKSVMLAIGKVIASYFSEKSFTQRLRVGDQTIFELPLMPVLIQEMSGEVPGGEKEYNDIPSVGVMYTEEPEGSLFKTHALNLQEPETFSGITQIQAAYGHNEAVVTGSVAVDTYYVDANGMIYYVVKKKKSRLIPSQSFPGTLEAVNNPKAIQSKPALSEAMILGLKILAKALEDFYKWPMDVEFVVKGNVINIVQARPINYKNGIAEPSYLKDLDKIKNEKFTCKTIGSAGGAVLNITNSDQVIFDDTLGAALVKYINNEKPDKVKCIIVKEEPPATSHEAAIFRGEGKAVIQLSLSLDDIQSLCSNELTIDVQQGLIIKDHVNESYIITGWINYPIPPVASILVPVSPQKQMLSSVGKVNIGKKENLNREKIADLLKKIKETEGETAINNVKKLLVELLLEQSSAKSTIEEKPELGVFHLVQSKQLNRYVQTLASVIDLTLEKTDLRRLFGFQFIQAAISQPFSESIVDGYSFDQVAHILKEESELYKTTKDPYSIQYLKVKKNIFSENVEKDWSDFVLKLEVESKKNKSEKTSPRQFFNKFLVKLNELDLLPMWLNVSFPALYNSNNIDKSIELFVSEYQKSKEMFDVLAKKYQMLKGFDVSDFAKPDKFDKKLKFLSNEFLDYFCGEDFKKSFSEASSNLSKMAALQAMKLFVETFDSSIKALKGSAEFELSKKVIKFKEILLKYYSLFEVWANLCTDKQKEDLAPKEFASYVLSKLFDDTEKKLSRLETFNQYVAMHKNNLLVVDASGDESYLKRQIFGSSSKAYSVASAVLGTGLTIGETTDATMPKTLEDFFTFIHQNILVILSTLNLNIQIDDKYLPAKFVSICSEIKNSVGTEISIGTGIYAIKTKISFLGIEFDVNKKTITYFYNMPLRGHSCFFNVAFNKLNGSVKLVASFMFLYSDGVQQKALIDFAELEKYTYNPKPLAIDFKWDLNTLNDVKKAIESIKDLAYKTIITEWDW
jgi:hypothetical protein